MLEKLQKPSDKVGDVVYNPAFNTIYFFYLHLIWKSKGFIAEEKCSLFRNRLVREKTMLETRCLVCSQVKVRLVGFFCSFFFHFSKISLFSMSL